MPNYLNVDKNRLIETELVERTIANCENPREKAVIALLFITGCRANEALKLARKDIDLTINSDKDGEYITVTLYTAKQQRVKTFSHPFRRLKLYLDTPFIEHFLAYADAFTNPDSPLFPFGRRTLHALVYKRSGKQLCPNNFRHNRAYRLFQAKATEPEVMSWFGHKDIRSTSAYASGKPIERKIPIL